MKATLFSFAVLAAGSIASPIANGPVDASQIPRELNAIDNRNAGAVGLDQVVDASTKRVQVTRDAKTPQTDSSSADLVSKVKTVHSDITSHLDDVKSTISKVKSGEMTKDAGAAEVSKQFSTVHTQLSNLATQLQGTPRGTVTRTFIPELAGLLITIFKELVATAEAAVEAFGSIPGLPHLLVGLFNGFGQVLVLLGEGAVSLVPTLVSAIGGIIAGIGSAVVGHAVAPVTGALAALPAGH